MAEILHRGTEHWKKALQTFNVGELHTTWEYLNKIPGSSYLDISNSIVESGEVKNLSRLYVDPECCKGRGFPATATYNNNSWSVKIAVSSTHGVEWPDVIVETTTSTEKISPGCIIVGGYVVPDFDSLVFYATVSKIPIGPPTFMVSDPNPGIMPTIDISAVKQAVWTTDQQVLVSLQERPVLFTNPREYFNSGLGIGSCVALLQNGSYESLSIAPDFVFPPYVWHEPYGVPNDNIERMEYYCKCLGLIRMTKKRVEKLVNMGINTESDLLHKTSVDIFTECGVKTEDCFSNLTKLAQFKVKPNITHLKALIQCSGIFDPSECSPAKAANLLRKGLNESFSSDLRAAQFISWLDSIGAKEACVFFRSGEW